MPFLHLLHALTHELEALFGQFGTDLFDLGRAAAPGERAVIITIEETEKEDKMYD